MNRIIKASLIAAAMAFAAGCSTQTAPSAHHASVSNTHHQVSAGTHVSQTCHGRPCMDKMGGSYTGDSTK